MQVVCGSVLGTKAGRPAAAKNDVEATRSVKGMTDIPSAELDGPPAHPYDTEPMAFRGPEKKKNHESSQGVCARCAYQRAAQESKLPAFP
jgi:hypothetical protein